MVDSQKGAATTKQPCGGRIVHYVARAERRVNRYCEKCERTYPDGFEEQATTCVLPAATTEQAGLAVSLDAVLNCYSPDDTVTDYQDKIRQLYASTATDTASASEELLPCPFCGCHGIKFSTDPVHYHRHTIKCEDCPGRAEFFSSTREQAVEAWNRRTAPAPQATTTEQAGAVGFPQRMKYGAPHSAGYVDGFNACLQLCQLASPAATTASASGEQGRRALELANAALIAAQPRDITPKGWERHEAAINATACALYKPTGRAPASASWLDELPDNPDSIANVLPNRAPAPSREAAVPQIKTWQERKADYEGSMWQTTERTHMLAEIDDLRAALIATGANLHTAVREAWRANAKASALAGREAAPLDERALFEAHMREQGATDDDLKKPYGRYFWEKAADAWSIWQARAALAQPAAPVVDAKDRRIQFLEGLLKEYGPKSLQYDIEHPNDGLNAAEPVDALASDNAATPVPSAGVLPPLPEPVDEVVFYDFGKSIDSKPAAKDYFTPEQYRQGQREAIAAARSAPVGAEWKKPMRDLVRVLRGVECGDDSQWQFIANVCANAEELLAVTSHRSAPVSVIREGAWSWDERAAAAEAFIRPYADPKGEYLQGDYSVQPLVRRLAAAILEWQQDVLKHVPEGACGIAAPIPPAAEQSAAEFNGEVLGRVTTYLSQFSEFQPVGDDSLEQTFRNIVECIERLRSTSSHPETAGGSIADLARKAGFTVDPDGTIVIEHREGICTAEVKALIAAARSAPEVPEGWLKALHAAVGAIYFDDNGDYKTALWDVVRNLAPELVEELEANPSAVWHRTDPTNRILYRCPAAAPSHPESTNKEPK
jgi:Lar family restriction alleviation protein